MTKPGDTYQEAVAEVARSLNPRAEVKVGIWTEGPDGSRDLDVAVWPSPGNLLLIECKDWARPVGISTIDALESKRRDLNAAVAMICSNSGFTKNALRKAMRVGIPALSALIEGDGRVSVEVQEEIYTRRITLTKDQSTWHFSHPVMVSLIPPNVSSRELIFNGGLVAAWLRDQYIGISSLLDRSRDLQMFFRFRQLVGIQFRGVPLSVTGVDLSGSFQVQWCSQVVQLGASSGMFDYLRSRVILGGAVKNYLMKNVDTKKWVPLADNPTHLPIPLSDGELFISLSSLRGLDPVDNVPAPDLNSFVQSKEIIDQKSGEVIESMDKLYHRPA